MQPFFNDLLAILVVMLKSLNVNGKTTYIFDQEYKLSGIYLSARRAAQGCTDNLMRANKKQAKSPFGVATP